MQCVYVHMYRLYNEAEVSTEYTVGPVLIA